MPFKNFTELGLWYLDAFQLLTLEVLCENQFAHLSFEWFQKRTLQPAQKYYLRHCMLKSFYTSSCLIKGTNTGHSQIHRKGAIPYVTNVLCVKEVFVLQAQFQHTKSNLAPEHKFQTSLDLSKITKIKGNCMKKAYNHIQVTTRGMVTTATLRATYSNHMFIAFAWCFTNEITITVDC